MISSDNPGLAAERQERIGQILRQRRIVRVNDLCEELHASPASVRRDLADLERRGLLHRVHGGAVGHEARMEEPGFDDKAAIAPREKQRIAESALAFIKPRDCIYLDGGSTVLAFAHLLTEMVHLTVVTNSLRVAATLAGSGPKTILTGGELRRLSQTFVGPLTRPLIERLHLDTAFMGTIGLAGNEMTTTEAAESYTKELVMHQARRVVLLADSSKIGKVSFVASGSLDLVDVLITDTGIRATDLKALKKAVRVVVA